MNVRVIQWKAENTVLKDYFYKLKKHGVSVNLGHATQNCKAEWPKTAAVYFVYVVWICWLLLWVWTKCGSFTCTSSCDSGPLEDCLRISWWETTHCITDCWLYDRNPGATCSFIRLTLAYYLGRISRGSRSVISKAQSFFKSLRTSPLLVSMGQSKLHGQPGEPKGLDLGRCEELGPSLH